MRSSHARVKLYFHCAECPCHFLISTILPACLHFVSSSFVVSCTYVWHTFQLSKSSGKNSGRVEVMLISVHAFSSRYHFVQWRGKERICSSTSAVCWAVIDVSLPCILPTMAYAFALRFCGVWCRRQHNLGVARSPSWKRSQYVPRPHVKKQEPI